MKLSHWFYNFKKSQQLEKLKNVFYTIPFSILYYNFIAHVFSSHNGGYL